MVRRLSLVNVWAMESMPSKQTWTECTLTAFPTKCLQWLPRLSCLPLTLESLLLNFIQMQPVWGFIGINYPCTFCTNHYFPNADGNHTKLEEMIKELSGALRTVKHEQDYMNLRERVHRTINESTNSRVVMWSFFEAFVLLTMTAGQVYYLKRFFEVRRVVWSIENVHPK